MVVATIAANMAILPASVRKVAVEDAAAAVATEKGIRALVPVPVRVPVHAPVPTRTRFTASYTQTHTHTKHVHPKIIQYRIKMM